MPDPKHPDLDIAAGVPYSDVNLRTLKPSSPAWTKQSSTSEVTSLDLEFSFLARAAASSAPLAGCGGCTQALNLFCLPASAGCSACQTPPDLHIEQQF